eukprot:3107728-Amphidinium_carterae.1
MPTAPHHHTRKLAPAKHRLALRACTRSLFGRLKRPGASPTSHQVDVQTILELLSHIVPSADPKDSVRHCGSNLASHVAGPHARDEAPGSTRCRFAGTIGLRGEQAEGPDTGNSNEHLWQPHTETSSTATYQCEAAERVICAAENEIRHLKEPQCYMRHHGRKVALHSRTKWLVGDIAAMLGANRMASRRGTIRPRRWRISCVCVCVRQQEDRRS